MPAKAPSPCAEPGCPALVVGKARCDEHKREYNRAAAKYRIGRYNDNSKFYSSQAWRRLSKYHRT